MHTAPDSLLQGDEIFRLMVESAEDYAREAGFDHHLVKPVDIDSLVSLIGHATDRA